MESFFQKSRYSQLIIDPNLLKVLLGILGFLILSNALLVPIAGELESIDGPLGHIINQIDLNAEGNFATWYSSMMLFLNSLCAYMLSRAHWSTNATVALLTAVTALGLVVLSIDDFISFHEYVEKVAAGLLSSDNAPALKRNLGPVFAISLAIIFTVLFAVPYMRTVQRENIPFLIGVIVFACLSASVEIVYRLSGCAEPWCLRLEVVFDEGSELSAILLFLTFQSRELVSVYENKN